MSIHEIETSSKFVLSSITIGVILGCIGAGMANLFRSGINWISSFEREILWFLPDFYFYFLTLTISAIIVHIIKKNLSGSTFHGVADSVYYAHKSSDCTDIRTGLLSTLAAFVSASGGASVGQYGPLVHFGTTFGAILRKLIPFKLSSDLFIGAGVAASISAGFGAPIAGLIFAYEVILRHYSHKFILAIATASGVAYAITQFIWRKSMVFDFPQYEFDLLKLILVSLIAGLIYGVVSILYMRSLFYFAALSQRIKLGAVYKTLTAILLLSMLGVFLPEVLGLGTEAVTDIFLGNFGLGFLFLILLGKILATSISLNFGFFGGVFSPALLIGASAGAFIANFLMKMGIILNFEYALVIGGMAAVAGSVIGAPITMIILVIELTGSYIYGLASLVGLAVAVSFTQIRYGASYFDLQLLRRGIDIAEGRMGLYLRETSVVKFIQTEFITVPIHITVGAAKKIISETGLSELVVVSSSSEFIGKVEASLLINFDAETKIEGIVDRDCIVVDHRASLSDAMQIAANFVGESIPVLDKERNVAIGVISENALFAAYLDQQRAILETEKK